MMKRYFNSLLTEDEQKVILFLFFFALLGMVIHSTGLMAEEDPEAVDSLLTMADAEIKFDLNSVSTEELTQIPGIGVKRAADILSDPDQFGFNSRSDLLNIKGIGEASYLKIKDWFYALEGDTEAEYEIETTALEQKEKIRININTASRSDLCSLKGIGPSKAEKIISLRDELGGFNNVDQLLNVKGIGVKTLEKFRENIYAGEYNE